MYIYNYLLEVAGSRFNIDLFKPLDLDHLVVIDSSCKNEHYVVLTHPSKCFLEKNRERCQQAFVDFMSSYGELAESCGADSFVIRCEIFFTGDNFSVELFEPEQLIALSKYNTRLLIDGYELSEDDMNTYQKKLVKGLPILL